MNNVFNPNSKLVKVKNIEEEDVQRQTGQSSQTQEKPQIVPDVPAPEVQEAPSEESIRIEQKLIRLRDEMGAKMREFNVLFNNNILPKNKSQEIKDNENAIFNGLINQFNLLNDLSPNEGTISLLVLCLRHLLSLRDAGNKLAYQVYLLEKSEFGEASEDKKRKEKIVRKQVELQEQQEQLATELKELEE